jgi:HEAT repeat protein
VIVPVLAAAQVPFDAQDPRARFRDPRRTPDSSQRLDEQVRKLKSDEPAKRLEGLGGLGEMNDPKAVELLVAAASDPDKRVRVKAIDMLGQVRAKEATPLLTQRLFLRDTDLGTKQHILASLGKIGDPRATGPLLDFLERDVDPAIRGNAIYALGDIGDRAALARLEEFAASSEDENLRRLATAAVKKIRARPEPELVVPALAVDRRGEGPQAPR